MKMEIRFRNRGSKENSTIILREIVTSFKIETTYNIYMVKLETTPKIKNT